MFNYFPKILYPIDEFERITATDITISAKIRDLVNSIDGIFLRSYIVKNGDRPDIVSTKLYDNPRYEYIILLVNNIHSIYDDWPKDSSTFNRYLTEKYGNLSYTESNYAFYYTSKGIIVSEEYWQSLSDPGKYRETYFQYETRLNEQKAKINVVDFSYIIQFEAGLQEILYSRQE